MCSLFLILRNTDPNLSFILPILSTAIFVCCRLQIYVNWPWFGFFCLLETLLTRRNPAGKTFDISLCHHWMSIFARFIALLTSYKPNKIHYLPSQKSQCHKRNGKGAVCNYWVTDAYLEGLLRAHEARDVALGNHAVWLLRFFRA